MIRAFLERSDYQLKFVIDRPGHDRRYAVDTSKIRRELGWEPEVDLEEGLARAVEWYRSHSDWVRKAKSGEYRLYYERFYGNRRASLTQL